MRGTLPIALVAVCCTIGGVAQTARPLPDSETFLREARAHIQIDDFRQRNYAYTATERQYHVDSQGRRHVEKLKVFESYPALPGEKRWERVLVDDNRTVSPAELARKDRERQEEVEAYLRKRARLSPAELEAERRKAEEERREQAEMLEDAFRVYAFAVQGRESIDGRDAIRVSLEPRRDVKTRTRQGGWARHFRGMAWISEVDYELARLDLQCIDTLSIGLGLLARIHEGSRITFERRPSIDGVWLPHRSSMVASARFLLIRRYQVDTTTEYSDYRRFEVDTSEAYGQPVAD